MHTFLSLDGGGMTLDFPHGRVPCPLLGLEGRESGSGRGREMGGEEDMENLNAIIYKTIKSKEYI